MADSPFTVGTRVRNSATTGTFAGLTGTVKQLDSDDTTLVTFTVDGHDRDYWVSNTFLVAEGQSAPQLRIPPTPTEVELAYALHELQGAGGSSANMAALNSANTELREQLGRLQRKHQSFRDQVREVAIRVADEQSWCDTGLNEVLEELGLEPKTSRWTVSFDVKVYVDVEDISDEDSAREEALSNLDISVSYGSASVSDWDIDSYSVNVESAD